MSIEVCPRRPFSENLSHQRPYRVSDRTPGLLWGKASGKQSQPHCLQDYSDEPPSNRRSHSHGESGSTGQHMMVGFLHADATGDTAYDLNSLDREHRWCRTQRTIPLAWLVKPGLPGVPTVWKASIIGSLVETARVRAISRKPNYRMTARE